MSASTSITVASQRMDFARLRATAREFLSGTDERTRAQRDALISFSIRVASAGIAYLSQAILARWMGTHEYGIFVFVWTWVLVLGGLSSLGLSATSVRLLPQYNERAEHGLARGLARGGRIAALTAGTTVAAAGVLALTLFGDRLESYTLLPAFIALACIPLYAFTDIQSSLARGRNWTLVSLLPPYILRPLLILTIFGLACLVGLPATAAAAAAAAVAATWASGLIQALFVNRGIEREIPAAKPKTDFRTWFKASMPLVAVYACELIVQNADVLIVSRYMNPSDVAIYFAAAKTMSLILFVQYAVGSAVSTRFSALQARGDREGLEKFVADAANWTFWPSLLGAAVILAIGKPLLALFGPDFAAGYPVMFVLVAGFLMRSAMGPADILLNMLGEQRICAVLLSLTAALDIALNLLMVPRWGLMGAASATAIALISGALMSYLAARKRLGLDIAIWHNIKRRS